MVDDLQNIDLSAIGDLPWVVKAIIVGVVGVVILVGGFWVLNKPQLEELDREHATELELRTEFEGKQTKAASLDAYKKQMEEIKQKFGELLHKLPSKTEVPGLLEDISTAGTTSGLRFEVFKPMPEAQTDFYAELPIQIKVVGNYHQLAEFISKVASLDRIVTVHDFTIAPLGAANDANKANPAAKAAAPTVNSDALTMEIIAKTYRYKDEKSNP